VTADDDRGVWLFWFLALLAAVILVFALRALR
jgi:hypothetical protein